VSRRGRILVVDDDHEILDMTSMLLSSEGHDVAVAASGEEALQRLREDGHPDLVLLDINMPGLDGWEVLRILREDGTLDRLPVIMFSVNFEIREKLRAMQQGAADYVVKPFETSSLLERVETYLAPTAGGR
jgi:CheY-like chemotaxis protein